MHKKLKKAFKKAAPFLVGGGIGGSAYSAGKAISKGLKAGEEGIDQAMGTIGDVYDRANTMIQPYRNYGVETLADLRKFTTGDPTQAVLGDPTYKFGYNQGTNALNNSAAARNRLLSGRAMKEMAQFGQDYGMSKYNDILSRKMGLAGFGFYTGAGQGVNLAIGQGDALAGLQTKKGLAKSNRYQGLMELGGGILGAIIGRKPGAT